MKIDRSENVLTIRETPGCLWVFGLFFSVIGGIFVYGSLGGFSNRDEVPVYALYLAFFMGSVGVATGLWMIFRAPVTNVIIDRRERTITHLRRGLTGTKQRIYGFDQVREFCLIEENDSEGDPVWSLGMDLADGQTIKISSLESPDEKFKRDLVFQTNEFLCRQMPSYRSSDAD
jgi:hypothetical protein